MPLTLYRGDSYAWQVRVWSDAEHTVPIDLAGATAAAEIHKGSTGNMAFDCAIEAPNIITLALPATAWDELGAGSGKWDLQLTFPDERVYTLLAGAVTITADVTP